MTTSPLPPGERLELLDALRGIALLGILTMNLLAFSGYYELKMIGQLESLPLRHYRFGPAEWLWRSLTYGERQPMRIVNQPAPAGLAG